MNKIKFTPQYTLYFVQYGKNVGKGKKVKLNEANYEK